MPPLHRFFSDLPLEAVAFQPEIFPESDWVIKRDQKGKALLNPLSFGLAISPNYLYFGYTSEMPNGTFTERPAGTFHEGLWEEQVLELFLASDSGPRYQEFNLSPSGAWWTQAFSSHRVREGTVEPRYAIEVLKRGAGRTSSAFFRVARPALLVDCAFGPKSRANVTAIVIDSPTSTVKHLCVVHDPGVPDFHADAGFQPFVIV